MRRSRRRPMLVAALAALALVSAIGAADASAKPRMRLEVLAAPRTPVAGATVVVRDAKGAVVMRGRTNAIGFAFIDVPSDRGTGPYRIRTSGGTAGGARFTGNVELITGSLRTRGYRQMDVVTTAAARYVDRNGGLYRKADERLLRRLGMRPHLGHMEMRHSSYAVDRRKLQRHHARNGGFNGTAGILVAALEGRRAFPDWSTRRLERHLPRTARQTSATSAVPNTACTADTVPASSSTTNTAITVYSLELVGGLASGLALGDPSLFLGGVAGMAFSLTPGMSTDSMLESLGAQLTCISQQLTAISNELNTLKVEASIGTVASCESAITTNWTTYQNDLANAQAYPDDPSLNYSATNDNFAYLLGDQGWVNSMMTTCNNIINNTLFNTYGQQTAAWYQLLSNYKAGTYRSTDKAALSQQSVVELQQFLQYWGTLEYEQSALTNEFYNYHRTFMGKDLTGTQQGAWAAAGQPCSKPPAISDLNGTATTFCQWQQNIADVWPGDIYTDEVANWHQASSTGAGMGGVAISAVPVSWGMKTSPNAYVNDPALITPSYLHDREIDKYDDRWKATAAIASYNAQPATDIGGLNQSIFFRRANATTTPNCSGNCGSAYPDYYKFGPFWSSWLNAAQPSPDSSGSYADVDLSPNTSGQRWQILAQDGTVVFSDGGYTCSSYQTDSGPRWAYYTSHNTIYSPNPWSANSGGSIGGTSPPCDVTVPIAFLKGRPWTQGVTWGAAPTITTTGTVAATATLAATGCPSTGCIWAISGGSPPQGLTLSTAGTFAWSGSAPGTTASVQVVASNGTVYSPPVTLTVQLT